MNSLKICITYSHWFVLYFKLFIFRADEANPNPMAPAEPQVGPDGEVIGGPRTMQQIAAQRRLQQTQAQVDEVMDTPGSETRLRLWSIMIRRVECSWGKRYMLGVRHAWRLLSEVYGTPGKDTIKKTDLDPLDYT